MNGHVEFIKFLDETSVSVAFATVNAEAQG